jgi:hypothetical protein
MKLNKIILGSVSETLGVNRFQSKISVENLASGLKEY